jgi:hypothetical protein
MRAAFFLSFGILAGSLSGAAAPALAQRAAGVMPLDRLLPEIRRTHPGQVYDADGPSIGPDGSQHYHLKWMTPDGRIEWLDTDARTGRVLGSSPGRDTFDRASRPEPAPPSDNRETGNRARLFGGNDDQGPPGGFYRRDSQDYGNGPSSRDDRGRDDRGRDDRGDRGRFRGR